MGFPNLQRGSLRRRIARATRRQTYPPFSIREPRYLVVLPNFRDVTRVDIQYPLLEPFAYAHIRWIPEEKKLRYDVVQPELSAEDRDALQKIEQALMELIDVKISVIHDKAAAIAYLEKKVTGILDEMDLQLPLERYARILYYLYRDFIGINEIEPLMHDPYIEDVGCSGLDSPVFVAHRKFGNVETNVVFREFESFSRFIIKLSERAGRYISYATPLLDGSLPDGSRIQASLAKDVTTRGPTFSIRKFRKNPYSPVDVVNLKTASPLIMAYLWFLIQYGASVLIAGGVSTGKTTMLNTLSIFIPPEERIISIEDTRELNLTHENWIPSVSRAGFGIPEPSGKRYGEVDLFDLLKESFRQNPDYVIVGEVRGKEAYVLFQGMSSGHPSLGTMHAGSVEDVIKRLETPPIELSSSLIEALDVLIVMTDARERGEAARRVKEVVEIQSIDGTTGKAHTVKTFGWIPSTDEFKESLGESEVIKRISFERGFSYGKVRQEIEKRKQVLEWMANFNVVQFADVSRIINLYYKDEKTLMGWVEKNTPPTGLDKKQDWTSATGLKLLRE